MSIRFTPDARTNFKALVDTAVQTGKYQDTPAQPKNDRAQKVITAFETAMRHTPSQEKRRTHVFEEEIQKLVHQGVIHSKQKNHILRDFHTARNEASSARRTFTRQVVPSSSGSLWSIATQAEKQFQRAHASNASSSTQGVTFPPGALWHVAPAPVSIPKEAASNSANTITTTQDTAASSHSSFFGRLQDFGSQTHSFMQRVFTNPFAQPSQASSLSSIAPNTTETSATTREASNFSPPTSSSSAPRSQIEEASKANSRRPSLLDFFTQQHPTLGALLDKEFRCYDFDYEIYSEAQKQRLYQLEKWTGYSKLALFIEENYISLTQTPSKVKLGTLLEALSTASHKYNEKAWHASSKLTSRQVLKEMHTS